MVYLLYGADHPLLMKRRQARDARDLARQRIERLFELAEEEH
ncbi:MAG: ribonuclease P, partial [Methanosarcinales archaeon]|nr:ribonuclease P [Methanosarcinales archaeon]